MSRSSFVKKSNVAKLISIYDVPQKDISLFLEQNEIFIDDEDPYQIAFKMLESNEYLVDSVPDNIIDWMIAYNLNISKIKIPTYNLYDIYLLSDEELKNITSLLKLSRCTSR